jgi:hypothetical protein
MFLIFAFLFFEWPEGNITNPDSYFYPFFKMMLIEVGIPSGYFSS